MCKKSSRVTLRSFSAFLFSILPALFLSSPFLFRCSSLYLFPLSLYALFSISSSLFYFPLSFPHSLSSFPQQADELAPAPAPASELMEDTAPEDVNAPATNEEVLREAAADAEPWTVRRNGGWVEGGM
jgi:hypothetical protein